MRKASEEGTSLALHNGYGGICMCKKQTKSDQTHVLMVFQLASLAIIVMNGTLISEIIYKLLMDEAGVYQVVVATAAVLSILEVMNNWASIKDYIAYYSRIALFAADIATLGLLYGQVYILTKLEQAVHTQLSTLWSLNFIIFSYLLLSVLYLIWDDLIIKDKCVPQEKRVKVEHTIALRRSQTVIGVLFILMPFILKQTSGNFSVQQLITAQMIVVFAYIALSCVALIIAQKLADVLKTIMEAEELKHV